MPTHAELAQRLEDKTAPEALTGCWLWTGAVNNAGYGKMWDGEKIEMAHRLSYRLHRGELGALKVLHRCDNPACVNPAHLFLGTQKMNVHDMIAKGRRVQGNNRAPLTAAQLARVRALPKRTPLTEQKALAAELGLSVGGMYKIRAGLRWGNIDG